MATDITDGEKRIVAAALRGMHDYETANNIVRMCLGLGPGMLMDKGTRRRLSDRIADLIEPNSHPNLGTQEASTSQVPKYDATATCDMSQSCRDTVACDPTERGVDSIYDWCRERLEGADGAEDELCCSIMRAIDDYRHPELVTARTVRAVDRGALLALADEFESGAGAARARKWNEPANAAMAIALADEYEANARRIREALGVVA